MARYFIMDVKAGAGEGGMACGPVSGPIVVEVQLKDEAGQEFYVSLADVEGIANFFKTDMSTYKDQLDFDMDDEMIEMLDEHCLEAHEYKYIFQKKGSEWYDVYRYLIYLAHCYEDEAESYIQATKGCWMDEIRIPESEVEATCA